MACPETFESIIQSTAPGSVDRLVTRLLIEADGDMRKAFDLFVADNPIEEHLWLVFLWMITEKISPDELKNLAEEPVRLRSECGPFRRQGTPVPS